MGERKVLVNYISPDFDPALLSRGKKKKVENPTIDIRGMVPFTIQCTTCREYTFKGKKFNGKKEIAVGHEYKGIRVFRLYLKCTACAAPITIRTDPENSGYLVESGAMRQTNIQEEKAAEDEADRNQKEEEEENMDAMQKLERKTVNNQEEIESMEALEELQALNRRNERNGVDHALQLLQEVEVVQENGLTAADEELVKSIKFGQQSGNKRVASNLDEESNSDSDESKDEETIAQSAASISNSINNSGIAFTAPIIKKSSAPVILRKKKKTEKKQVPIAVAVPAGMGMLAGYGSDSDSN